MDFFGRYRGGGGGKLLICQQFLKLVGRVWADLATKFAEDFIEVVNGGIQR